MIDHEANGYVARSKDSEDLMKGIHWVLGDKTDYALFVPKSCTKSNSAYSQHSVALNI